MVVLRGWVFLMSEVPLYVVAIRDARDVHMVARRELMCRGTLFIRKRPPPQDLPRALGIALR